MKRLSLRFVMHLFDFIGAVAWGVIVGAIIILVLRAILP